MSNPQQPELRRSGKSATESKSAKEIPETRSGEKRSARPHGTDKGRKGGGKGGGVPPGQQPPYPE
ncbi:hypothetical protein SMD20_01175 [Nonomuraea sp. LP-02]|uniref:hypothetical protein n=1 Tax=Nonomuraea sp. LP-02 TaxID=3097960 RepID=UPI002E344DD4|nr:hypothetical protein [Nonomuraea sp. LP-02]MED7922828.1 hypothetical protein [Nonomuraea sp. LP-02]